VSLHPRHGAWELDLQELLDAITPATRALLVNAPNNPTGWTLSRAEQQALLDHCRRTGTWIVADEVYERLWWGAGDAADGEGGRAAPSFLDIATAEDRLVVTQSFSKSFLMTGWRLGWLVLPADTQSQALAATGKLLEFNSSCAPVFAQRGALQALAMADTFVPGLAARLKAGRDTLLQGLQALPGIEVAPPPGGMYAFFRVEGQDDSLAFAKRLVAEHGLGLAPGSAFGAEGEGWLRWCFASKDLDRLRLGVQRLAGALRL
jgi:aspartate/methionine/tyrosine aminotransferase